MKRIVRMAIILGAALIFTAQAQTPVTFWHSMGGGLGEAVDRLVNQYNAQSEGVEVVTEYIGDYDDGINKLRAAIRTNTAPHMIQIYEIGTRTMADLADSAPGSVVIVQDLMERDDIDPAIFLEGPANYYTINGQFYSFPFNSSTALMYYNADMFSEAGLDPENPPQTFEDYEKAFERLSLRDESGEVSRYGLAMGIDSYVVEQLLYNQGEYYCNNENGRTERATAVGWDGPAGTELVRWWADMVEQGYMANVGRDGDAARQLFVTGRAAMHRASSASLTGLTEDIGDNFELRTTFMPYPEATGRNGVSIGGGSLWLLGNKPQEEIDAAWNFIKWLAEPEQQAQWHIDTGYFPVTAAALELPNVQELHATNPNYTTALDQLLSSKTNNASAGCLVGGFTEIRSLLEGTIENVINNDVTPEAAVAEAAARANEVVQRFSEAAGQ